MISKEITIKTPHGLHLRVAAKIVRAVKQGTSKITFYKGGKKADTRSILDLLVLEATQDSPITVVVEGGDEQNALQRMELVLIDGAGI